MLNKRTECGMYKQALVFAAAGILTLSACTAVDELEQESPVNVEEEDAVETENSDG